MSSLSHRIALYLNEAGAIDSNQVEAFTYCINGILEFSAITTTILITAIITKTLFYSLTTIAVLISLRTFCGGVHMPGAFSCFFISYLTYLLVLFFGLFFSTHYSYFKNIFLSLILFLINMIGPVKSKNKKNRLLLFINSLLILICCLLFFNRQQVEYCSIILITVLTVFILQLIEFLKQKGGIHGNISH